MNIMSYVVITKLIYICTTDTLGSHYYLTRVDMDNLNLSNAAMRTLYPLLKATIAWVGP